MDFLPTRVIHLGSNHLDNVFGHDGPHHAAFLQGFAFDESGKEACGPHVACPCGVNYFGFHGWNGDDFIATLDEGSFGTYFHHSDVAVLGEVM